MYKINDIFYMDEEYSSRVDFCNNNNFTIVEITPDVNGRRFKIAEPPKPSQYDLIQFSISSLKQQLADMDYKTSKYVDGDYTEQEWNLIVAERKRLRNEINKLELLI